MKPRVFISYRRKDTRPMAQVVFSTLKDRGFEVYFDGEKEAYQYGESYKKEIQESMERADVVLLLIGKTFYFGDDSGTMTKQMSSSVRSELELAIKFEVPIIPLLVNGSEMPAVSSEKGSTAQDDPMAGISVRDAVEFDAYSAYFKHHKNEVELAVIAKLDFWRRVKGTWKRFAAGRANRSEYAAVATGILLLFVGVSVFVKVSLDSWSQYASLVASCGTQQVKVCSVDSGLGLTQLLPIDISMISIRPDDRETSFAFEKTPEGDWDGGSIAEYRPINEYTTTTASLPRGAQLDLSVNVFGVTKLLVCTVTKESMPSACGHGLNE